MLKETTDKFASLRVFFYLICFNKVKIRSLQFKSYCSWAIKCWYYTSTSMVCWLGLYTVNFLKWRTVQDCQVLILPKIKIWSQNCLFSSFYKVKIIWTYPPQIRKQFQNEGWFFKFNKSICLEKLSKIFNVHYICHFPWTRKNFLEPIWVKPLFWNECGYTHTHKCKVLNNRLQIEKHFTYSNKILYNHLGSTIITNKNTSSSLVTLKVTSITWFVCIYKFKKSLKFCIICKDLVHFKKS